MTEMTEMEKFTLGCLILLTVICVLLSIGYKKEKIQYNELLDTYNAQADAIVGYERTLGSCKMDIAMISDDAQAILEEYKSCKETATERDKAWREVNKEIANALSDCEGRQKEPPSGGGRFACQCSCP